MTEFKIKSEKSILMIN